MGPRPTRRGSRCSPFVGRASSHDLGRAGTLALQGPPGAFSEERSIWLRTGNRASLRMGYLIQWPDPSLALRARPEPRRDERRCPRPLHSRHQPRSGTASRNDIVCLFLLEALSRSTDRTLVKFSDNMTILRSHGGPRPAFAPALGHISPFGTPFAHRIAV